MELKWGINSVEAKDSEIETAEVKVIFTEFFAIGNLEKDDCKKEITEALNNVMEIVKKYRLDW